MSKTFDRLVSTYCMPPITLQGLRHPGESVGAENDVNIEVVASGYGTRTHRSRLRSAHIVGNAGKAAAETIESAIWQHRRTGLALAFPWEVAEFSRVLGMGKGIAAGRLLWT